MNAFRPCSLESRASLLLFVELLQIFPRTLRAEMLLVQFLVRRAAVRARSDQSSLTSLVFCRMAGRMH